MESTFSNYKVAFYLLDNSFDLLKSSLEIVKNFGRFSYSKEIFELKSALICATASVELLLKAKIASIDWKQLFNNPKKADKDKLLTGEFYSIKSENCIYRLEKISKIKLNTKLKAKLENIRRIRNKVIHYHYEVKKDNFLNLIACVFDIFIEFYKENIFDDLCEEHDRTFKIDFELKDIQEYLDVRLDSVKKRLANHKRPMTYYLSECPNCFQDAFILKDNANLMCLFCGEERFIPDEASRYKAISKKCPVCNIHSMTLLDHIKEDNCYECIICGYYTNKPSIWGLKNGKRSKNLVRTDL